MFSFLFFLCTSLYSQQWVATHNENQLDDRSFGIVTDRAGNIYVTGYVTRPATGEDIFVHATGLQEDIRENDNVVFDVQDGKKGLNAVNVKLA